jgi:hypothetical protein
MAGSDKFADALNTANLALTLAVEVGGELVPLVKGIVTEVEKLTENDQPTIEYSMVLQIGQEQLTAAGASFQSIIDKAQAELDRLNSSGQDNGGTNTPPAA